MVGVVAPRGNPHDDAMVELIMKTLQAEGGYPLAFESEEDAARNLPRFIDNCNVRHQPSALGYLSPAHFGESQSRRSVKSAA